MSPTGKRTGSQSFWVRLENGTLMDLSRVVCIRPEGAKTIVYCDSGLVLAWSFASGSAAERSTGTLLESLHKAGERTVQLVPGPPKTKVERQPALARGDEQNG